MTFQSLRSLYSLTEGHPNVQAMSIIQQSFILEFFCLGFSFKTATLINHSSTDVSHVAILVLRYK